MAEWDIIMQRWSRFRLFGTKLPTFFAWVDIHPAQDLWVAASSPTQPPTQPGSLAMSFLAPSMGSRIFQSSMASLDTSLPSSLLQLQLGSDKMVPGLRMDLDPLPTVAPPLRPCTVPEPAHQLIVQMLRLGTKRMSRTPAEETMGEGSRAKCQRWQAGPTWAASGGAEGDQEGRGQVADK